MQDLKAIYDCQVRCTCNTSLGVQDWENGCGLQLREGFVDQGWKGRGDFFFFFQRKEGKIRGVLDVRLAWS